MNKIPDGCVLIARRILESDIWISKPAWWLKVWIYILCHVNHSDVRRYQKGSNLFNLKTIWNVCNLKEDGVKNYKSVGHLIKWLKCVTQITTTKVPQGIIISVVNYDSYQNLSSYKGANKKPSSSATSVPDVCQTRDTLYNKNERMKECNIVTKFKPPTIEEVKRYCLESKNSIDPGRFIDFYTANGWVQGKGKPIKDWKACVRLWERNSSGNQQPQSVRQPEQSTIWPEPSEEDRKKVSELIKKTSKSMGNECK